MRGGDRKWRRGRGRSHQLSAHPIHDTIVAELLQPCVLKISGGNVAGARVALREVRVTDVHDGEGVRHRRRRRLFAEVERRRRTRASGEARAERERSALLPRKNNFTVHVISFIVNKRGN